jgi:adenine-specific DNA-methyltransferase
MDYPIVLTPKVGREQTLLVVGSAFRGRMGGHQNLTVKKIPKAILSRCEWGKDDYSSAVKSLETAPPKPAQQELEL